MNTISRDELKTKIDGRDGFRLVEALPNEQFREWHLPGAINIPMGRVSALAPNLLPNRAEEIVVYCGGPECQASSQVARALTALGYERVLVYHEGRMAGERVSGGAGHLFALTLGGLVAGPSPRRDPMITCEELMTPSPTCCQAEHTIEEVAEMMKRRNVGLIPVVGGDSARLIGVLTDRDIVINVVAEGLDPRQTAVSEVMTPEPVSCRPEEPADKILELMAARQVRRIPVVDERGGLVGIVAQADVATRLKDPQRTGEIVEAISGEDYGRVHEERENRLQSRGATLEGRAAR